METSSTPGMQSSRQTPPFTDGADDGDWSRGSGAVSTADLPKAALIPSLEVGHTGPPTTLKLAIVRRPIPKAQTEDPRAFQVQQIRRRFSPIEESDDTGSTLGFKLLPSDPDFPFDMDGLQCKLRVPSGYPKEGRPSLRVTNQEMDRGYQINVEKGFHALATSSPHATLLGLMNALDKHLEGFLAEQKAETFKLITYARRQDTSASAGSQPRTASQVVAATPSDNKPVLFRPTASFTAQQKIEAQKKRAADIRQLEARLGRQPLFCKLSDGLSFLVPVQSRLSEDLPTDIRDIKTTKLIVPVSYNLEPCRIDMNRRGSPFATSIEAAFERRARGHPEMNLMAHINYLAQNMQTMAKEEQQSSVQSGLDEEMKDLRVEDDQLRKNEQLEARVATEEPDRSHLKFIPRPPEWSNPRAEVEVNSCSDSYDSEDCTEDDEDGGTPIPPENEIRPAPERGILLSFPYIELYGIELIELISLSLSIKCERCKDVIDVKNVESQTGETAGGTRNLTCKKCAMSLCVGMQTLRMAFVFESIDPRVRLPKRANARKLNTSRLHRSRRLSRC